MPSQLTLVLGGIRSGKSAFAEKLVRDLDRPTLYVATGQPTDPDMERRISLHRERRPGNWTTLEEPIDLAGGLKSALDLRPAPEAVLVDSVDHWVSNVLLRHENDSADEVESLVLSAVDSALEACGKLTGDVVVVMVSSEVGLTLVAPYSLGRRFQDLLGLVNQRFAAAADNVYLVAAGIPVKIKPNSSKAED